MNIEEQKEFIRSLLSYKDKIDSDRDSFMINSFESEIANTFKESFPDLQVDKDYEFNVEDLFSLAEEHGEDPINYIKYMFKMFQGVGEIEHNNQKIDFSTSMDIFETAKENFKDHKKSEDIKNF
jgi:hypothetical protein